MLCFVESYLDADLNAFTYLNLAALGFGEDLVQAQSLAAAFPPVAIGAGCMRDAALSGRNSAGSFLDPRS